MPLLSVAAFLLGELAESTKDPALSVSLQPQACLVCDLWPHLPPVGWTATRSTAWSTKPWPAMALQSLTTSMPRSRSWSCTTSTPPSCNTMTPSMSRWRTPSSLSLHPDEGRLCLIPPAFPYVQSLWGQQMTCNTLPGQSKAPFLLTSSWPPCPRLLPLWSLLYVASGSPSSPFPMIYQIPPICWCICGVEEMKEQQASASPSAISLAPPPAFPAHWLWAFWC